MRAHVKKTPLTLLLLVGWLFAAPVVFGDDLTAERQEQNAARREQTADPQARKAAQRAERQELKAEERAKRKGLRAEQQAQQAQRREEKAERQEQKDTARGTIYREARAARQAEL